MNSGGALIHAGDGCQLHVERVGSGPPVVLIPGLGGKGSFWSAVRDRLVADWTIVTGDHRGAGASDRWPGRYSVDRLAQDVLDTLDVLDIRRAHVVGHSTGGVIAQLVALHAPERVRSLCLSGTWARPDAHFRLLFEMRLATLTHAGPGVYARQTVALGYPPAWIEGHGTEIEGMIASAADDLSPIEVAQSRIRMLLDHPGQSDADLARIRSRTLVLGAEDDAIVPFHHQERLRRAIPAAAIERLKGGHFFPKVGPARFAAALAGFLPR